MTKLNSAGTALIYSTYLGGSAIEGGNYAAFGFGNAIAVDSSGWLHRLTLEEPRLLLRCREAVPDVALRAIRFHLAPALSSPQGAVSGTLTEGQREVSS